MSEKPVAPIKTLARYEPDTVYIGTGEYVATCVRADDGDYYLAADVDAIIDALQREAEEWKHVAAAQAELHDEAEEYAERLAEALAGLITWILPADTYLRLGIDPDAPMRALKRAHAALGRTER